MRGGKGLSVFLMQYYSIRLIGEHINNILFYFFISPSQIHWLKIKCIASNFSGRIYKIANQQN